MLGLFPDHNRIASEGVARFENGVQLPSFHQKKVTLMSIEEKVERLTEMVGETNRMLARLLGEVTPNVEAKRYINIAEASQMTGLSAVS